MLINTCKENEICAKAREKLWDMYGYRKSINMPWLRHGEDVLYTTERQCSCHGRICPLCTQSRKEISKVWLKRESYCGKSTWPSSAVNSACAPARCLFYEFLVQARQNLYMLFALGLGCTEMFSALFAWTIGCINWVQSCARLGRNTAWLVALSSTAVTAVWNLHQDDHAL